MSSFKIVAKAMVENLTDGDLDMFAILLREEQQKRIKERYRLGYYPELTAHQKDLIAASREVEAISHYRDLHGFSLVEIKMIFDCWREDQKATS